MRTSKITGSVLVFVGFLLSPLSWWNDLFINWPLAYGFASALAHFAPSVFEPSLYLGYLGTNVAGLYLMHRGVALGAGKQAETLTLKGAAMQLLWMLLYTVVVIILVRTGVITPLSIR